MTTDRSLGRFAYTTFDDLVRRVRSEYLEMPGLRLTRPQASRLLGLDSAMCERVLQRLVDSAFLTRSADGRYGRHVF